MPPTSKQIQAAEAAVAALAKAARALSDAAAAVRAVPTFEIGDALEMIAADHPLDAISDAEAAVEAHADALRSWLGLHDREAA